MFPQTKSVIFKNVKLKYDTLIPVFYLQIKNFIKEHTCIELGTGHMFIIQILYIILMLYNHIQFYESYNM